MSKEGSRKGGLKGGPRRAKKLSRAQRRAIGKHAIEERWRKQREREALRRQMKAYELRLREASREWSRAVDETRRRADGYG